MSLGESYPNHYAPGPLSPVELAEVLRTSLTLLRADHGHDVFTLLDVLAEDEVPSMSRDACYQVARTVLTHLIGIGATETREPVRALHIWHQRNRDLSHSGMTLERAFAETLRRFEGDTTFRPVALPSSGEAEIEA